MDIEQNIRAIIDAHFARFSEEIRDSAVACIMTLKEQPCEDSISRKSAIDLIDSMAADATSHGITPRLLPDYVIDGLMRLPSFRVVEKLGEWLDHQEGTWIYAKCSKCESVHDVKSKYCPTCGAKMKMEGDDDLS